MAIAIPLIGLAIAAGSATYNAISNEQAKKDQADAVAKQNAAIKKAAGQQNTLIDTQVSQNLSAFGVTKVDGQTVIDPNAAELTTAAGQVKRQGKQVSGNLNAQAGASGVIGGATTSAGVAGQDVANNVSAQLDQIVKQADQLQTNAKAQKDINLTNAEAGVAVNDANLAAFDSKANASTISGILGFGSDAMSIISKSYKPTANANNYGINAPTSKGFIYGTQNKPSWMYYGIPQNNGLSFGYDWGGSP
jgi:hypothetical protein